MNLLEVSRDWNIYTFYFQSNNGGMWSVKPKEYSTFTFSSCFLSFSVLCRCEKSYFCSQFSMRLITFFLNCGGNMFSKQTLRWRRYFPLPENKDNIMTFVWLICLPKILYSESESGYIPKQLDQFLENFQLRLISVNFKQKTFFFLLALCAGVNCLVEYA